MCWRIHAIRVKGSSQHIISQLTNLSIVTIRFILWLGERNFDFCITLWAKDADTRPRSVDERVIVVSMRHAVIKLLAIERGQELHGREKKPNEHFDLEKD